MLAGKEVRRVNVAAVKIQITSGVTVQLDRLELAGQLERSVVKYFFQTNQTIVIGTGDRAGVEPTAG